MPPIDEVQNWHLIRGEEENGFTTLEFWRNFITCDDKDRDILVSDTMAEVLWVLALRSGVYNQERPLIRSCTFVT